MKKIATFVLFCASCSLFSACSDDKPKYTEWPAKPGVDMVVCLKQLGAPFTVSADGKTYSVESKYDHDVRTQCMGDTTE